MHDDADNDHDYDDDGDDGNKCTEAQNHCYQ